jgi:hypothetical protein
MPVEVALTRAADSTANINLSHGPSPDIVGTACSLNPPDKLVTESSAKVHIAAYDFDVCRAYPGHYDPNQSLALVRNGFFDIDKRKTTLLKAQSFHIAAR